MTVLDRRAEKPNKIRNGRVRELSGYYDAETNVKQKKLLLLFALDNMKYKILYP